MNEEVRNLEGGAQAVDQPLPLPEGMAGAPAGEEIIVSAEAVPEPELALLLALGLLLLALTPAGRAWIAGLKGFAR